MLVLRGINEYLIVRLKYLIDDGFCLHPEQFVVLGDLLAEGGDIEFKNFRFLGDGFPDLFSVLEDVEELGVVVEEIKLFVVLLEEHLSCLVVFSDEGVDVVQFLIQHLNQLLIDPHASIKSGIDALHKIQTLAPKELHNLLFHPLIIDRHLFYYQY